MYDLRFRHVGHYNYNQYIDVNLLEHILLPGFKRLSIKK